MDQDTIQKLVTLCHQLRQDGQQPSVALLRGKAPMKVPVTMAIEAIRQFSGSPTTRTESNGSTSKEQCRIAALESQVKRLEAAVALLEKRLNDIGTN